MYKGQEQRPLADVKQKNHYNNGLGEFALEQKKVKKSLGVTDLSVFVFIVLHIDTPNGNFILSFKMRTNSLFE